MSTGARQEGFTLIEVLVSMALAMVVFGATLTALDTFQANNRVDVLRNETQDNARSAIDRFARDLRNVAAPRSVPELPGALEQAEEYSIVFQTIDSTAPGAGSENPSNAMRVRYCLNNASQSNEVLWRQVRRWTEKETPAIPSAATCPDLTPKDWDSSTKLVDHITNRVVPNRPLFVYGPTGWKELAQIATVAPNVYLNVNPGQRRPGESQLTSTINLRNANRQPIATFTVTEKNGHVLLNASESVDPDGLALSYQWSEGVTEASATVIPSTAQQYETPLPLVSGKTYTFWLKVTDPGGLTNSTKRTVTIP
jgi:prepilin-type N-terminal cleavage/methylation domain-containing protein